MIPYVYIVIHNCIGSESYYDDIKTQHEYIYEEFYIKHTELLYNATIMKIFKQIVNFNKDLSLYKKEYIFIQPYNDKIKLLVKYYLSETYLLLTEEKLTMIRYIISLDSEIQNDASFTFGLRIAFYKRLLAFAKDESFIKHSKKFKHLYSNMFILRDSFCPFMKLFVSKVKDIRDLFWNIPREMYFEKIIRLEINFMILKLNSAYKVYSNKIFDYKLYQDEYLDIRRPTKLLIYKNAPHRSNIRYFDTRIMIYSPIVTEKNAKIIRALVFMTYKPMKIYKRRHYNVLISILNYYSTKYRLTPMLITNYPIVRLISLTGHDSDKMISIFRDVLDKTKEVNQYIGNEIENKRCYTFATIDLDFYSFKKEDGLFVGLKPCLKLKCRHYIGCEHIEEWYKLCLETCYICGVITMPVCYFDANVYATEN